MMLHIDLKSAVAVFIALMLVGCGSRESKNLSAEEEAERIKQEIGEHSTSDLSDALFERANALMAKAGDLPRGNYRKEMYLVAREMFLMARHGYTQSDMKEMADRAFALGYACKRMASIE